MSTNIQTWYDFVLQQMAAESYLNQATTTPNGLTGVLMLGSNNPSIAGNAPATPILPGATRMTATQAADFTARYQIISHLPNTASGFSGTLMREIATGAYTFAMRSTEFFNPNEGGDWERDGRPGAGGEIAFKGFAFGQIASMEAYYEHLKLGERYDAASGQWVSDSALNEFKSQFGAGGTGGVLNVSGYSLSGQLASVFTALHPEVNQTYVYNASGLGNIVGQGTLQAMVTKLRQDLAAAGVDLSVPGDVDIYSLFSLSNLGERLAYKRVVDGIAETYITGYSAAGSATLAQSKITQLFGGAAHNDSQIVANSGVHVPATKIFIEDQPNIQGLLLFGQDSDFGTTHSITLLIDSLAVMRVFEQLGLDMSTTQGLNAAYNILSAGSNQMATGLIGTNGIAERDSLEKIVSGLYKLITGNDLTLASDAGFAGFSNLTNRDAFYQALDTIQKNTLFQQITGLVTFENLTGKSTADIATLARAGIATRYALQSLNPFAVVGDDALYAQHNASGMLDRYDPAAGTGTLTDSWIRDRAAMLSALIQRNLADNTGTTISSNTNIFYRDEASRTTLRLGSSLTSDDNRQQFKFGSDANNPDTNGVDILTGGSNADHLYGMGGADMLNGADGNDYLEGGKGSDTYLYNSDDSHDTILDTDGLGSIVYNGVTLVSPTSRVSGTTNLFRGGVDDEYLFFIESGDPASAAGATLKINERITVKNFHNGNLGITLPGVAAPPPAPAITRTIVGDMAPVDFDAAAEGVQVQLDDLGNVITAGAAEAGRADSLFDSTGNDLITSGGGNDVITASRGGDDAIDAGGGRDQVNGGVGADLIEGGAGSETDILDGGAGDDRIYADTRILAAAAIAAEAAGNNPTPTPALTLGPQGDWLDGGSGKDELFGSGNNDVLQGGDDNDSLRGGAGHDLLDGGGGRDILLGGSGNDFILGGGSTFVNLRAEEIINPGPTTPAWGYIPTNGVMSLSQLGGFPVIETDAADYIDGGDGDDFILAGQGDDIAEGGAGADTLVGLSEADTLRGGAGDDKIFGDGSEGGITIGGNPLFTLPQYHGADILYGGAGNDSLTGDGAADELYGETGDDTLIGDATGLDQAFHGADYLDGGDGADRIFGYGQDDTLFGGAGDDFLEGDSNTVTLYGNDYLDGEDGIDTLLGDGGDDTLFGGAGNDFLFGDADDTPLASQGKDYLDGEDGDDYLRGYAGDDQLYGGAGVDYLLAEAGDDLLDGGDGADELHGGEGKDQLAGGDGDDLLFGEGGDDTLDGGAGADVLNGGEGMDRYVFSAGFGEDRIVDPDADSVVQFNFSADASAPVLVLALDAATGASSLKLSFANGDALHLDNFDANNPLNTAAVASFQFSDRTLSLQQVLDIGLDVTGTAGDDVIQGTALNERILALAGNDNVLAGGGADTVDGGTGDDFLDGGAGADNLQGGDGADTLRGGAGNDTLAGGAGDDVYQLGYGMGQDTLIDAADSIGGTAGQIALDAGVDFTSLAARRVNDDLAISIRGTAGANAAGVLIQDYYAASAVAPPNWTIAATDGTVATAEALVAATIAADSNQLQSLKDDYLGQQRAAWFADYAASGYTLGADGAMHRSDTRNYSASFTIGTQTQTTVSFFVNGQTSTTVTTYSLDSGYLFSDGLGSRTDFTGVITDATLESDAATIYAPAPSTYTATSGYETTQLAWTETGPRQYTDTTRTGGGFLINNADPNNPIFLGTYNLTDHIQRYQSYAVGRPTTTTGSSLGIPSTLPRTVQMRVDAATYTTTLSEINAGAGDNIISGGTVVDGGDGEDAIYNAGFVYGGAGDDVIVRADLAYGGDGDDSLYDSPVMAGGSGSDLLEGGTGANRYLIDPADSGVDLISDTGDSELAYLVDYYETQRGISDWEFRLSYGGTYEMWYGEGGYFNSVEEAAAEWGIDAVQMALADGQFNYIEPLPPLPAIAADDYAALAPLYAAGVIELDTVELDEGIALSDIRLTFGEALVYAAKRDVDGGVYLRYEPRPTLDLSWGAGSGVRVALPEAGDAIGSGIEQFRFADGSVVSIGELLSSAATFQFEAGSGAQTISYRGVNAIQFGAGITPDMLSLGLGSLLIRVGDSGDEIHLTQFDPNDALASHVLTYTFADGSVLTHAELIARGFDFFGTAGNDAITGTNVTDRIEGREGNDFLQGGAGDDHYTFRRGDGQDEIYDFEGNDTLHIGSNLTVADLLAERSDDSLIINIKGTDDSIYLGNWFVQTEGAGGVGQIVFNDGTVLDRATIARMTVVPTLDQPLSDQTTREDNAYGFAIPADTFGYPSSGAGDALSYSATLADGSPLPEWLTLDAASGVFSGTPGNFDVAAAGDALTLIVTATTPFGHSASSNFVLEVLNVNDAPTVASPLPDQSAIAGQAFSFIATAAGNTPPANNFLMDATDTGTLVGSEMVFDTYLDGDIGNNTFTFTLGDGAVYVYDYDDTPGNVDRVEFAAGIAPADIAISQDQYGSVTLSINGTTDSLALQEWLYSDGSKIEQLSFADGTLWGVDEILSRVSTTASAGNDFISGSTGRDSLRGLAGNDGLLGGAGNDTLLGGAGDDFLEGGGGSDILSGGSGVDNLVSNWSDTEDIGNDLLFGGDDNDYFYSSIANDLLIGGTGDDYISENAGNDVLLFNRGDGADYWARSVYFNEPPAGIPDSVSLGGGISYADLAFTRNGDDLVLNTGNGESITFSYWLNLNFQDDIRAISTLQIVAEAMPDYAAQSADPLFNQRIQQFDFIGLANQFQAALAADPTLTTFQLAPHLADYHLGGSDTQAIGGDLAYLYGRDGHLNYLNEAELRAQLSDTQFGVSAQTLTKTDRVTSFADADLIHGDSLTYSATLADGSALPGWLAFDAATQTFSGIPPETENTGSLGLTVTATDSGGLSASNSFTLAITNTNFNFTPGAGVQTVSDPSISNIQFAAGVTPEMLSLGLGSLLIRIGDSGDEIHLTQFDPNDALASHVQTYTFADGTVLTHAELIARGFDLIGSEQNDVITGTNVTDRIEGRGGDDLLQGGAGDDRYTFRLGDGADTIVDAQGNNTLFIGSNLTEAGLEGAHDGDNLMVKVLNTTDSITLSNWFAQTEGEGVNRIEFGDGSSLDRAGIEGLLNRPPVANPDAISVFEDGGSVVTPVATLLANDTDPNVNDVISVISAGASVVGVSVALLPSTGSGQGSEVSYDIGNRFQELGAGQTISDSFAYTISDNKGATASSVVNVTITGVNDAPLSATPLATQQTDEDAPFSFTIPAGTFTDIDNGDVLSYSVSLSDNSALPAWLSFDAATQTFSGTPGNDDVGNLGVQVTATDTGGLSASSNFTLNILNVNDTPTAGADIGAATEDGGIITLTAATLLANDTDPDSIHGDTLSIIGVSQATSGAAVSLLNGDVQYDLGKQFQSLGIGQTTTDSFSYSIADSAGAISSANVVMTITGVNDAPVTADDTANVQEDLMLSASGNVLANDSDVDQGTQLTIAAPGTFTGGYGRLVLGVDGGYTYTLDNAALAVQSLGAGQSIIETFSYQAMDGRVMTPSTLSVTLTGTNDAPVAAIPLTDQNGTEGTAFSYQLPANAFADIDQGDVLSYSATLADGSPLPDWLSFDAASLTFSSSLPDGAGGLWDVRVTATDIAGASASSAFRLDIANLIVGTRRAEVLTGTEFRDLIYGLGGNDRLLGGASADVLDGGSGSDVMIGGEGDDTYYVDAAEDGEDDGDDHHGGEHDDDDDDDHDSHDEDEDDGDQVIEAAGEGYDRVYSSVNYTLPDYVEALTLTGSAKKATGNALDNVLTGNAANNTLKGNAGADTLDGGAGADKLIGGSGNDTYLLGRGYGADTIQEKDGTSGNTDVAQFLTGITVDQLWFRHVKKDLEVSVIGSNDKFIVQDWYKGSTYHVEQFKTADNRLLLENQVENLVQAMASFAPPAAGQTTLPQNYQDALAPVIAANWQ